MGPAQTVKTSAEMQGTMWESERVSTHLPPTYSLTHSLSIRAPVVENLAVSAIFKEEFQMSRKMLLFLSSILYIIGVAYPGSAAIDPNSIVAVWLCDEEGEGGTLADASGNGHDGEFVGDVDWTDGKFGKALEFPGVGGSRVEIPDEDSLTLDEWTITVWAKLNAPPAGDWAVIVVKDPGNGLQNYSLDMDGGGMVFSEVTSGGAWSDCNSGFNVYDDTWHFLAASYDGDTLRIYVDGETKNEQKFGTPDTNTAPVAIGGRMDNSQPLLGIVDDIGLFSVALGEGDLKTIMEKGLDDTLGLTAVEPASKLTTTWGQLKQR